MIAAATSIWHSMSIDEYAALESEMGAKLVRVGGLWWRQVRPFFYRPLLPYREFNPDSVVPPLSSIVVGAQYAVPAECEANSHIDLLAFENPRGYSLGSQSQNSRRHIRRASETVSVRRILDVDEFIATAHPVYNSFYERTKYGYKPERTEKRCFASWARSLFRFPKVEVCGAYRGQELASVSVAYVVEDIAYTATFFSRSDALVDYVSELMLHAIRERAAASDNVTMIFAAAAGMQRGLDDFYLRRGARLIRKPARLKLNPLISVMLRNFKYDKLLKLGLSK